MNGRHKKLLIIAYAFPPHSVVGSMRPLRMAKYLEETSGWSPVILTVDKQFSRNDSSLLDEVPHNVPIYRTGVMEPAFWFEHMRQAFAADIPDGQGKGFHLVDKIRDKILSVLSEAASFPDPQVLWNLPVIMEGKRIIRKEGISVILVTSPPWSLQIAGYMLKKITGIPWVVDYRDPWTDIKRKSRPTFIDTFEKRLEGGLVGLADLVLSTSDTYTDDLIRRFSEMNAGKFKTLHNGFDEMKFNGLPAGNGNEKFTIAHLGTMYSQFNPNIFLHALKQWMSRNREVERRFELLFIGKISDDIRRAIDSAGLGPVTTITGFVPHREAISLCAQADLLLLSMGTDHDLPRGWLPSKLFEYLALNRPILAYGVEGEASAMVRSINKGHVETSSDFETAVDFMNELFMKKWQGRNLYIPWRNEPAPMQTLHQSYLMRRLGGFLDGLT